MLKIKFLEIEERQFGKYYLNWKLNIKPIFYTCSELLWLMQLLCHIGVSQDSTIQVFTDSQSAHALAHGPAFHGRMEHIEVHYHVVLELVES